MDYWGLKEKKGIILDFDGTMCRLFYGFDLRDTILCLKDKMETFGVSFSSDHDAFDVFDVIQSQLDDRVRMSEAFQSADEILKRAEMSALETCLVIDHCIEFITTSLEKGYKIGISTNNSEECVSRFLSDQITSFTADKENRFDTFAILKEIPICGRLGLHPDWMKPNPWSLFQAAEEMEIAPGDLCFIGDTLRDYDASVAADIRFIPFAPTEKKRNRFKTRIRELDIVSSYRDLLKLF